MSDRIEAALDHLYRAADLACAYTPSAEITSTRHIEKHIGRAIAVLEGELSARTRRDNCSIELRAGDVAYLIEKGTIAEFRRVRGPAAGPPGTPGKLASLLLCPRCYDNNWIIGEPDDL